MRHFARKNNNVSKILKQNKNCRGNFNLHSNTSPDKTSCTFDREMISLG